MRLRTFEASTMQQALAELRAALGPEAVIVATREDGGRVRLTAAADTEEADLEALLAPAADSPARAEVEAALGHHGLPAEASAALLAGVPPGSADPAALLATALAQRCRFAPDDRPPPSGILLVGPTGAGKTAATARLAAMAVLAGREVEVWTADTDRAGGLEQLRALLAPTGLVPVPIAADGASPPAERPLLVDGPGVNPFHRAEMAELAATVRRLRLEPLLVLPAGLDTRDAAEIAANFQVLGVRRMITTKLDAARRLGGLLAAAELGLELAWATTGREIGRPLVPWTAAGLARLLLARAPQPRIPRP